MLLVMGYCIGDIPVIISNYVASKRKNDSRETIGAVLYVVHHALVSSIVCVVMDMGFAALLVSYLLIVYETSTVFLSARNMLKDLGLKTHPLCWICEKLFVVWFTVSRIGWGTFCVAYVLFEDDGMCPMKMKVLLALFQTLNCLWFYVIAKIFCGG